MKPRETNTTSGATWTVPADVAPGATLLDALRDEGIAVPADCGGVGTCGLCSVRTVPAPEPSSADRERLSESALDAGWRLACGVAPRPGMVVHIPESAARVPVSARTKGRRRADAEPVDAPVRRRGAGAERGVALAVDLGTTTVAVALVSLPEGGILASGAVPNAQRPYGADVVSRIEYGSRGPAELARLRDGAVESIRAAAAQACRAAGIRPASIGGGAVACNPTMAHLLLGANPAPLGRSPFRLVVEGTVLLAAKRIGFPGSPEAIVTILPAVSATLGADAVGGAVALGFDRPGSGARLLVDVGTNTEMVLSPPGRGTPVAASAASGGAFEGSAISCGMRAEAGAVLRAGWDGEDLSLEVEGGGAARGIAGSGLLDLVALLLRFGIVDPSGRMLGRDALFGSAPPGLLGRLLPGKDGDIRFLVSRAPGRTVTLSPADIRQFQLAKGAIRAALDLLLEEGGVAPSDVAGISLAGAFGDGIGEESAFGTGLFPEGFRGRLARSGNSSLQAAVEAAADTRFAGRTDAFARRIRPLSLPDRPEFPARFLASMDFFRDPQVFPPPRR